MLIRRKPKHQRKRPIQQKTICEAECWAALLVIGILVLFCLSCIIHDYLVRRKKRKLDALKKTSELESANINLFSSDKEVSRDEQMRNIRNGIRELKECGKLEAKWPKKKRNGKIKGITLRNNLLYPITEEEEEGEFVDECEKNKPSLIGGEDSIEDNTSEDESRTPEDTSDYDPKTLDDTSDDEPKTPEDTSDYDPKIPEELTMPEFVKDIKGKQKETTAYKSI